jgi:hypothetical protein
MDIFIDRTHDKPVWAYFDLTLHCTLCLCNETLMTNDQPSCRKPSILQHARRRTVSAAYKSRPGQSERPLVVTIGWSQT